MNTRGREGGSARLETGIETEEEEKETNATRRARERERERLFLMVGQTVFTSWIQSIIHRLYRERDTHSAAVLHILRSVCMWGCREG